MIAPLTNASDGSARYIKNASNTNKIPVTIYIVTNTTSTGMSMDCLFVVCLPACRPINRPPTLICQSHYTYNSVIGTIYARTSPDITSLSTFL